MLDLLQKVAIRLQLLKPWMLALTCLSLAATLFIFLASSGTVPVAVPEQARDIYLIPALMLFLWALFFYSFLNMFAIVPQRPEGSGQLILKFKVAITRACFYVLGWLLIALSLALVYVSYYLALVWI